MHISMPASAKLPLLLIPEKTDAEFEQVWASWMKRGGEIRRLGKYWIKDEALATRPLALYGNQTFVLVLAQIYDLSLVMPDDTLIARLDKAWTKRDIQQLSLGQLNDSCFPAFIKPVIPKLFIAGIFNHKTDFDQAVSGLGPEEEVLHAGIISSIHAEARSFVLNGAMLDIAFYEGTGNLEDGYNFLAAFLEQYKQVLPRAIVIDIAYAEACGWFVLEFNAPWGAGLNNCDAGKVMDCIVAATTK